jgi:TolB-like protein/Tfp pilus assembly protein PilF
MFTDMVGYTFLSQRNESLALELLDEQRQLIRPHFTKHTGKEVKTIGDAFLVEFASALEAVRCAFEIQQSVHESNSTRSFERKMLLRIGIHVGDVVFSAGDIHGDAVNIASRIESIAEPGGICVTEQVYDQIRNKFEFPIEALGRHELKNVQLPIEIYKIVLPWERKGESLESSLDRRRIAVMPFVNISPDSKDEYFADGMTEELISTMSKISGLRVIARTSVMGYKGGQKKISDVANELQVGAVLEGSVRKMGDRVRISVQLINSQTSEHLWAESYDRELKDVFAIQSDISKTVAEALKIQLMTDDKEKIEKKPTKNTEAYVLYLKGRYFWNKRTFQGLNKAIGYFVEAIRRDPMFALAYAGLADTYIILENWGFLAPKEALPKAMEYVTKALEIDDLLAEAHTSMASLLVSLNWDWYAAEQEFKLAIKLNPNYATAHQFYAHIFLEPLKRWDEALSEIREAERLDPLSAIIGTNLGDILLAQKRFDEAIKQFRNVLDTNPDFAYAHSKLGVSLILKSLIAEGTAEIEKARSISPENLEVKAYLAFAYAVSGRTKDVDRMLEEMKEVARTSHVEATLFAEVYSVLGNTDSTFEWLNRASEGHSSLFIMNLVEPHFDSIRSDPRFRMLLEKIGLP